MGHKVEYQGDVCCACCNAGCFSGCYYVFCGPCAAGSIAEELKDVPETPCHGSYCGACLLFFCLLGNCDFLYIYQVRSTFNAHYGMNESECGALCKACCCRTCTFAQIHTEHERLQSRVGSIRTKPPKMMAMTL